MSKRVAIKYCGGCDPGFDRVAFAEKLRAAAANSVEWATLEDGDCDIVLMICGCETACPERTVQVSHNQAVVTLRDDHLQPAAVIKALFQ